MTRRPDLFDRARVAGLLIFVGAVLAALIHGGGT
jgi:hypothetical protein